VCRPSTSTTATRSSPRRTMVMTLLGSANHDPAGVRRSRHLAVSTAPTRIDTSPSRRVSTTASAPRWPSSRPAWRSRR
jgi:hypothetical protein